MSAETPQPASELPPAPPAAEVPVNAPALNGHIETADTEMSDAVQPADANTNANGTHTAAPPPSTLSAQPAEQTNLQAHQSNSQTPGNLTPGAAMAPRTTASTRASTPAAAAAANASNQASTDLPGAIIPSSFPHGSPARQFLNQKVVPALLEGMKQITAQQPEKPLHVLGEFLLKKSQELEGS